MIAEFHADAEKAFARSERLDDKILWGRPPAAGARSTRRPVALALRQAYGGTELVGPRGQPWRS